MPKQNPRRANGSRRTALRKRVAAEGLPCALCGGEIDYSLPSGDPLSYELDEIIPVSRGGDPYDPGNVQPSHRCCNQAKGAALPATAASSADLPLSRDW